MPGSLTLYEVGNGIAVLTLNNPRRRNALSYAMMDEILGHLVRVGNDDDARVVVIRAEGPVFSSGHDLRELAEGDVEDQTILFARCTELMEAVRLLQKPVIAQVQGLATAAGCQLVATCDLAVASGGGSGQSCAFEENYGDAADGTADPGVGSAGRGSGEPGGPGG